MVKYNDLLDRKRKTLRQLALAAGGQDKEVLKQVRESRLGELAYYCKELREVKLARMRAGFSAKAQGGRPANGANDAALLAKEIQFLEDQQKWLEDEVNRVAAEVRTGNENHVDLRSLEQEVAQEEKIANQLAAEAEALKVELNAPPRVRLVDEP
jgi:uncharacterized protein involved in exopolysaccharide biosynthesis